MDPTPEPNIRGKLGMVMQGCGDVWRGVAVRQEMSANHISAALLDQSFSGPAPNPAHFLVPSAENAKLTRAFQDVHQAMGADPRCRAGTGGRSPVHPRT